MPITDDVNTDADAEEARTVEAAAEVKADANAEACAAEKSSGRNGTYGATPKADAPDSVSEP